MSIDELERAGYLQAPATAKECSCGTMIIWFITPAGKWMPFSALKDSRLTPHHAVCQRVKNFRAADKKHAERAGVKKPKQLEMFFGRK